MNNREKRKRRYAVLDFYSRVYKLNIRWREIAVLVFVYCWFVGMVWFCSPLMNILEKIVWTEFLIMVLLLTYVVLRLICRIETMIKYDKELKKNGEMESNRD